nr:TOM1-like protein 2 [Ipomoea trifida]GMD49543.1 TOM1-like protein 2 [Ipomoea batatas]GMD58503.1 TOM1-like protein 2 [Ipomoea batatas]
MNDKLMDKVSSFGEILRIGGSEVGQKISAGMSSMSFKMREFFQGPNQVDMLIEEATAETLDGPDWETNLELCDMINQDRINSVEVIRGIKKRIVLTSPRIQYFALVLLETVAENCDKAFSEIAAEKVLDDMVKLIDDPQTVVNNRNKALMLIESWGESSSELRYLPVFEVTYKSLKERGISFPCRNNESLDAPPRSITDSEPSATFAQQIHDDIPPPFTFSAEQIKEIFDVSRNSAELLSTVLLSSPQPDALQDELTTTLAEQCRHSINTVQGVIQTAGDNETLLFEALNVNDELQKALSKYEDMMKPSAALSVTAQAPAPAMVPVATEPNDYPHAGKEEALIEKPAGSHSRVHGENKSDIADDLEMVFCRKSGSPSELGHDDQKLQPARDDLITF